MIDNQTSHGSRIEYALANLAQNRPDITQKMSWHWTKVTMNQRTRRVAGLCIYTRSSDTLHIELSSNLFDKMNEQQKTSTVVHELAHAVCLRLRLDSGHGPVWKSICRDMGGDGERCLQGVQDVQRNKVRRFIMLDTQSTEKRIYAIKNDKHKSLMRGYMVNQVPQDQMRFRTIGVILCDPNTKIYTWERMNMPEYREATLPLNPGWNLAGKQIAA